MRTRFMHWTLGFLAVNLSACGAEEPGPLDETQVGESSGANTALAETGPDLAVGSSGNEVAEVNRYLTEYGYFPNEKLVSFDPRWRSPLAEAPARADLFDETTAAGLRLLQRNYGFPQTGIVDSDTRGFLRMSRCGNPDNVDVMDPLNKFGFSVGHWNGQVTLRWRLVNGPPQSGPNMADFDKDQAAVLINAVLQNWQKSTRHVFQQVTTPGEEIVIGFGNTFFTGCPKQGQPVCGIACASPPQPGGTTCALFRTDTTWSQSSFKTAALHELGHAFGLGHSGYSTAAMYPALSVTSTSPDDRNAAIHTAVGWSLLSQDGDEDIAVVGGSSADVYVLGNPPLGNDLSLWKLDDVTGWQNLSTTVGAKRLGASASFVWLVQDDGDVYRFDGSWTKIAGECGTDIAVGSENSVWMLGCSTDADGNHSIYKWNGSSFMKDMASGAKAMRIGFGRRLDTGQRVPWIVKDVPGDGISGAGAVFRRDANETNSGTHWDAVPAIDPTFNGWLATDISANHSGYTWIVSNITPVGGGTGGRLMVFDEQPSTSFGTPPAQSISGWVAAHWGGSVSGSGLWVATSDVGMPYTVNNLHQLWVAN